MDVVDIDFKRFASDVDRTRLLRHVSTGGRRSRRGGTEKSADSYRQTSAVAGVAPSTLHRICEYGLIPSARTYARLCRWMGCSLDYYVRP